MGCWVGFWRRGWFLLKPIKGKLLNNPGYPIHVRPFDNSRTLSDTELRRKAMGDHPIFILSLLIECGNIPPL